MFVCCSWSTPGLLLSLWLGLIPGSVLSGYAFLNHVDFVLYSLYYICTCFLSQRRLCFCILSYTWWCSGLFFRLTPVGYRRSIWRGIRDRNWEGTWGARVLPTLLSICFNKQGFLSVFFECRLLIFLQNICLSDLFSAHNPFGFYVSISPFSYS